VKATPAEQNELLRLQSIDTSLQRLDHAARNLPQDAERTALEPQLATVRAKHAARTGELEDARIELRRVESDVEVVEARIDRDSGRLQQTASVKDIQGLETELASLRTRRSDLEEIELTVMERIEELEATLADIDEERTALTAQFDALESARGEELGVLDARRAALGDDRETVLRGIPTELVALYEKQRARYGTGAALLQRGVSLGSNTALNANDLDTIRRAAPDDVVLCPESSCILIRNEESGL
jgi:predicted  nucleic acid-binding Zn-ribbon protein